MNRQEWRERQAKVRTMSGPQLVTFLTSYEDAPSETQAAIDVHQQVLLSGKPQGRPARKSRWTQEKKEFVGRMADYYKKLGRPELWDQGLRSIAAAQVGFLLDEGFELEHVMTVATEMARERHYLSRLAGEVRSRAAATENTAHQERKAAGTQENRGAMARINQQARLAGLPVPFPGAEIEEPGVLRSAQAASEREDLIAKQLRSRCALCGDPATSVDRGRGACQRHADELRGMP